MSTARAVQNDLQQATGVHFSDHTIRNTLHEGGLRARLWSSSGPCAHCPAPWSSIGICHWTPELAGPPLAPCAFHKFTLSTWDRRESVWRSCGECYHIVQHDLFGGGSVVVWGGLSMEGRTDIYRLDPDCH